MHKRDSSRPISYVGSSSSSAQMQKPLRHSTMRCCHLFRNCTTRKELYSRPRMRKKKKRMKLYSSRKLINALPRGDPTAHAERLLAFGMGSHVTLNLSVDVPN